MASNFSLINVLENILTDQFNSPILNILPEVELMLERILTILIENIDLCIEENEIEKLPKLHTSFTETYIKPILNEKYKLTSDKVRDNVITQLSYVWCDDESFIDLLHTNISTNAEETLKLLIEKYCKYIGNVLSDSIPKIIMHYFINSVTKTCDEGILKWINQITLEEHVYEDENIQKKRAFYKNRLSTIQDAQEFIRKFIK